MPRKSKIKPKTKVKAAKKVGRPRLKRGRKSSASLASRKLEELKTISKTAPYHVIVEGDGYLYFSIQPTQEDISLHEVAKEKSINFYAVKNFKNTVVGYVAELKKKPLVLNIEEFGAAIFYTKTILYKKSKVIFSDQKVRIVSFDSKDYFVSVKWKSNNPSE